MCKKVICVGIILCLVQSISVSVVHAENVQSLLRSLGTGPDSHVELQMRDNTRVKGYIIASSEESVILSDRSNRNSVVVPISDIQKVKGYNLSTGQKVAIGVGVGAGIALVVLWIWLENAD